MEKVEVVEASERVAKAQGRAQGNAMVKFHDRDSSRAAICSLLGSSIQWSGMRVSVDMMLEMYVGVLAVALPRAIEDVSQQIW